MRSSKPMAWIGAGWMVPIGSRAARRGSKLGDAGIVEELVWSTSVLFRWDEVSGRRPTMRPRTVSAQYQLTSMVGAAVV
jgi:hypothetical protein